MSTTAQTTTAASAGWTPVPDVDKLTILKLLADGRPPAFVAAATNYTAARVRQIAGAHGYPDRDKLAWAVDVVAEEVDQAERERVTDAGAGPQTRSPAQPTSVPRAQPALRPAPKSASKPAATAGPSVGGAVQDEPRPVEGVTSAGAPAVDSVRGLIARGGKSQRVRTQRLAGKAADAVDALERALQREEVARRAAADSAQAKARERADRAAKERKIREELAQVERRRTELRRQLRPARPSRPAPAPREIDPKKVRQWARANGVAVPDFGRVPVSVVEQYLAASTKAA